MPEIRREATVPFSMYEAWGVEMYSPPMAGIKPPVNHWALLDPVHPLREPAVSTLADCIGDHPSHGYRLARVAVIPIDPRPVGIPDEVYTSILDNMPNTTGAPEPTASSDRETVLEWLDRIGREDSGSDEAPAGEPADGAVDSSSAESTTEATSAPQSSRSRDPRINVILDNGEFARYREKEMKLRRALSSGDAEIVDRRRLLRDDDDAASATDTDVPEPEATSTPQSSEIAGARHRHTAAGAPEIEITEFADGTPTGSTASAYARCPEHRDVTGTQPNCDECTRRAAASGTPYAPGGTAGTPPDFDVSDGYPDAIIPVDISAGALDDDAEPDPDLLEPVPATADEFPDSPIDPGSMAGAVWMPDALGGLNKAPAGTVVISATGHPWMLEDDGTALWWRNAFGNFHEFLPRSEAPFTVAIWNSGADTALVEPKGGLR